MNRPLEGIRVLELTTYVAAPCCGRLMADLGADVIKVERLTGDDWRETGKSYDYQRFSDDENPVFDIYNSGKRFVSLNLKSDEGMAAFRKLLSQADVFITNTRPKALKRLGIAYEDIKDEYPSLVYGILLGYGEKGPDAALPAFDVTAFWARSGFLRDLAPKSENYQPVFSPFSSGDTISGITLFAEICAALFRRERTGLGDLVRSGLYQNAIFTVGTMQIITQKPFGRVYPQTPGEYGIQGSYRCADDEWIYIAVGYAPLNLPKIYKIIERPELSEDPRFATGEARSKYKRELRAILEEGFAKLTSSYCLEKAKELDLPLVLLRHFSDISEDEQAWANGYLENVEFRTGRTAVMPSCPLDLASNGETKTVCAPHIGADTAKVLAELGYSDHDIEKMKQSGAIRTAE